MFRFIKRHLREIMKEGWRYIRIRWSESDHDVPAASDRLRYLFASFCDHVDSRQINTVNATSEFEKGGLNVDQLTPIARCW